MVYCRDATQGRKEDTIKGKQAEKVEIAKNLLAQGVNNKFI